MSVGLFVGVSVGSPPVHEASHVSGHSVSAPFAHRFLPLLAPAATHSQSLLGNTRLYHDLCRRSSSCGRGVDSSPRNIQLFAAASPRRHGMTRLSPRRRGDSSPRNIHVVAADDPSPPRRLRATNSASVLQVEGLGALWER